MLETLMLVVAESPVKAWPEQQACVGVGGGEQMFEQRSAGGSAHILLSNRSVCLLWDYIIPAE